MTHEEWRKRQGLKTHCQAKRCGRPITHTSTSSLCAACYHNHLRRTGNAAPQQRQQQPRQQPGRQQQKGAPRK